MSQVPPGQAAGFPAPVGPYSQPPQGPHAPQGGSSSKVIWIVLGILGVFVLMCGGVLVALLLPAISAARGAAQRVSSSNNMRQIGLAMHSYHDLYKQFPPAYTTNWEGKPMHSWRTAVLPFTDDPEAIAVYEQVDWDKPWDDPANAILQKPVPVYSGPGSNVPPDMTVYLAVVDPKAVFRGADPIQFREILDGTANTVVVVEGTPSQAVPWASVEDVTADEFINPPMDFQHRGGQHIMMADGSIRFLSGDTAPGLREALVTRAAADTIEQDF